MTLTVASFANDIVDSASFATVRNMMKQIRKERPTVALVISGGGAKGACVPGILKYIEEKGIPVDVVLGVSIGGLVGGMYSLGYTPEYLDSLFASADWSKLLTDYAPRENRPDAGKKLRDAYAMNLHFNGKKAGGGIMKLIPDGLVYGYNLYNLFSSMLVGYEDPDEDFSNLPIPFVTVSTDMSSTDACVMMKGDLVESLRSTMSIPFIFSPVRMDKMVLVDGGTRNNYPVDVARALGADYVIGIDLSQRTDQAPVSTMLECAFQTLNAMGEGQYRLNAHAADVTMFPDMKGYNALSFSREAIADIVSSGYAEALKHSSELDTLVKLIGGRYGKKLSAEKARDLTCSAVKIDSVVYEGLNEDEISYFRKKSRLVAGNAYSKEDFDKEVENVYLTGAFEKVTFRLYGKTEPYTVAVKCVRAKKHTVSLGVRGDTEVALAAIGRVGLWTNTLYGPKLDISLRLALSPYAKLQFKYQFKAGFGVGADLKTSFTTAKGLLSSPAVRNYHREFVANEAALYLCSSSTSRVGFDAGVRFFQTPFVKTYSLNGSSLEKDAGMFGSTAFAGVEYDSMDDGYFPTKGISAKLKYDFLFAGKDITPSHYAALSFKAAIPVGEKLALLPSVDGRYRFGGSGSLFFMDNYAGGRIPGRYYDAQIPFFGINGVRNCGDILSVASLSLRYNITGELYASATGSCLWDGKSFSNMNKAAFAAGIEAGYNTLFGPVFANVGWNFETRSLTGYIGVGFDF